MDAIPEVLMLVATCIALAIMFIGESNAPGAIVFAVLAVLALLLLVWLLRTRRRAPGSAW